MMASVIADAGRLILAEEVTNAIEGVQQTVEQLLAARNRGAFALPLDPLWLEWKLPNNCDQIGLLICTDFSGNWVVRALGSVGRADVSIVPMTISIQANRVVSKGSQRDHLDPTWQTTVLGCTLLALRAVMLLTAKNAPLIRGDADDYDRLNRQRAKSGKPPVLGCRPVRWNLSRLEQRAGVGGLTQSERERAIGHIVRGHLKVRKSGSYWWSPHFRNVDPEDVPPVGRDYQVGI